MRTPAGSSGYGIVRHLIARGRGGGPKLGARVAGVGLRKFREGLKIWVYEIPSVR